MYLYYVWLDVKKKVEFSTFSAFLLGCVFLITLCFFNSPFKVMSQPGHDASKVRASGPGLDTKGVSASLPVEFTIDARDAGEGLLTVQILVCTATSYSFISKSRGII